MFRLMKRGKDTPIHTDTDFDAVMSLLAHIAKKSVGGPKWYKPENDYLIGCRVTPIPEDNHYYFIYEDKE